MPLDKSRGRTEALTRDRIPLATAEAVARLADAPAVLIDRIQEAIGTVAPGQSLATASPEALLEAAEALFAQALRSGCTDRTGAVALLVVDALVTYAFERASDDPPGIEDRAARAIRALASLGTS